MSNFKVSSELKAIESNGKDVFDSEAPVLFIKNHATRKELVLLEIGNTKVAVRADSLVKAVQMAALTH